LNIPALSSYGIGAQHISSICAKAAAASSMKPNPVQLTDAELREILSAAM